MEIPEVERAWRWSQGVRTSDLLVGGQSGGAVDAGLAEGLERINQAGYKSAQSCSGLVMDHERKKITTGGYISWFRADLTEEQVGKIEQAANAAGLDFKQADLFFMAGVSVRADRLTDGTSEVVLRKLVNEALSLLWPKSEMPRDDFMDWQRNRDHRREELLAQARQKHGGVAINTDIQLINAWEIFVNVLLES